MPPPPPPAPSGDPPRRGLSPVAKWILAGVALAAVAAYVVSNAGRWQFEHWAGAADQEEFAKKIRAASDPRLDEALLDTVRDDRKSTSVRRTCAMLLIDRNHQRDIEDLLQHGSPREQRIALAALTPRPWFHKEYLLETAYPVRDVLLAWVSDSEAPSADRAYAMTDMLPRVWPYLPRAAGTAVPPEILKAVAGILSAPVGDDRDGAVLRVAAAGVVTYYRWCGGAGPLLAAAGKETDAAGTLRLMQSLVTLEETEGAPCKDALPEDRVFAVVAAALSRPGRDSIDRGVRMGALAVLERKPAWAARETTAIRAILDSDAAPEERGSAFPALLASGDAAVRADIAAWIHDRDYGLRSRVVQAVAGGVGGLTAADHLSLLVGYFGRDEKPTDLALREVALRLRNVAGSWLGFPDAAGPGARGVASGDMGPLLRDLAAGRSVGGKTRAEIGDAWWNWLAGKNGVAADALKTAFAARDAFWEKANAGDLAAARAALDAAPAKDSPLWEYERGRLAAKAKAP